MNPEIVPTQPVRQNRSQSGRATQRAAAIAAAVILFGGGLLIGTGLGPPRPLPTSPPPGPTPFAASTAPSAQVGTVALGIYHLTSAQAQVVTLAVRFFTAYNSGNLAGVMSLLSANPELIDCNYATQTVTTLNGRPAVAAYLGTQFSQHDTWVVQFYNMNPDSSNGVGLVPIARSNDVLKRLGLAGGSKRDFPVDLVLALAAGQSQFGYVDLAGASSMCQA